VEALVRDVALVVDVFGQFDLHEAELRGVRLSLGVANVPELELDLRLPGGAALPSGTARRGADYRVTLRATDVSELSLADFEPDNVVSEYSISVAGPDEDGRPTVRVALTCAPGCDVDFRCRELVVAEVAPAE
jgi:hypothetical protein